MAANEARLPEIIGDIYAAAADSERWVSVLEGISGCVGADGYSFSQANLATPTVNQMISNFMTESVVRSYNRDYAADDILLERTLCWPVGTMVGSRQLMTRRELLDSRLYQEYLQQIGIEHSVGGFVSLRDNHAVCLGISREARSGDFSDAEIAWLNRLAPHLDRACSIQRQLLCNRLLADTTLEALDHLAMAMLLLDSRGRVVASNTLAEQMLVDGVLHCDNDRRLVLRDSNNRRIFERLLRSATSAPSISNPLPGGAFHPVDPYTGRPGHEVMVWPFAATGCYGEYLGMADVVVFARPYEPAAARPEQILQQLYGLSAVETRVCSGLLVGLTTQEIADAQGLTARAVHGHCKQILHKTDARRQPDLVRLAASGATSIGGFHH